MNILAIGNSFSEDANRYLHEIAQADGVDMTTVNLMIGGCPLSRHYENMQNDAKAYSMQFNGVDTQIFVTMKEVLFSRKWDYITLQQVSHESPMYNTYQPYLNEVYQFVKANAPDAKIGIHQTWAYEEGSERLCVELGYQTQREMFDDLKSAYHNAYQAIDADFLIPSGELFQKLIAKGYPIHRDTFHASLGFGRYALGLLWYQTFTGNSVLENTFSKFDEPVTQDEMQCAKEAVASFINE